MPVKRICLEDDCKDYIENLTKKGSSLIYVDYLVNNQTFGIYNSDRFLVGRFIKEQEMEELKDIIKITQNVFKNYLLEIENTTGLTKKIYTRYLSMQ